MKKLYAAALALTLGGIMLSIHFRPTLNQNPYPPNPPNPKLVGK